jgi:hypothetical protein
VTDTAWATPQGARCRHCEAAVSAGGDLVDKEGFDEALKKATERAEKAEKEAAGGSVPL